MKRFLLVVLAGLISHLAFAQLGCTGPLSFTLQGASTGSSLTARLGVITPASCNAVSNGAIAVNVLGGTPNYTYSWQIGSNAVSTALSASGFTITGLSSGVYTISVTDANGCNLTSTLSATVSSPLSLSATATLVSNNGFGTNCFGGADGVVNTSVSGGTSPYSFIWNTLPARTTATASGLSAGTYSATVTDANGCAVVSNAVSVTEPTPVSVTINVGSSYNGQQISCNGQCNATASVVGSGGAGSFRYLWSSGSTSSSVSGLCAGNHSVTVTDVNNCSVVRSFTVNQPNAVTVTGGGFVVVDDLCMALGGKGSITFSAVGGTAPYQVAWSGTESGNPVGNEILTDGGSYTIANLTAGSYTVIITDVNGCQLLRNGITVRPSSSGTPLSVSNALILNSDCALNNGSVRVTPTGGSRLFRYTWTPNVSSDSIANNLPAGVYNLLVTDANNCTASIAVDVISSSNNISMTTATTVTTCAAADGRLVVNSTYAQIVNLTLYKNGVQVATQYNVNFPYTFSNLSDGAYRVMATTQDGCSSIVRQDVGRGTGNLNVTTVPTSTSNCVTCDGSIQAVTLNGTSPFVYRLVNVSGTEVANSGSTSSTSFTFNNLCAGSYKMYVTSAGGCEFVRTVELQSNGTSPLTSSMFVVSNISCSGQTNGSIRASQTLPVGTTCQAYSNGNLLGALPLNGLTGGSYTLICRNSAGCDLAVPTLTVLEPRPIELNISSLPAGCANNDGAVNLGLQGGTAPVRFTWSHNASLNAVSATGLSLGAYLVTATDANGCSIRSSQLTLGQNCPCAFQVDAVLIHPQCNASDGQVDARISGGQAGSYSYLWSNGKTTSSIAGLRAGSYCVTITDRVAGCSKSKCFYLENVVRPSLNITNIVASTCASIDGSMTVNFAQNNGNVNITWNTGSQTGVTTSPFVITGLSAGTYNVTVTDNNGQGCLSSFTDVVIPRGSGSLLLGSPAITAADCGTANGAIGVVLLSGTAPLVYNLTNSSGTLVATRTVTNTTAPVFSNLAAGLYTVSVNDNNGCTASQTVIVNSRGGVIRPSDFVVTSANCAGTRGAITSITNPLAGYNYAVYPPNNLPLVGIPSTNLIPGVYTIVATNSAGCIATTQVTIREPSPWIVELYPTPQTCTTRGSISAVVTGGSPQYTFQWNNGSTTASITGLLTSDYTVTINDENGCAISKTVNLAIDCPCNLEISEVVVFNAQCNNNNGSIRVITSGANGAVQYNWSPNISQSSVATSLIAGTYQLTVTDTRGCTATQALPIVVSNTTGPEITNIQVLPATCLSNNGAITFVINSPSPSFDVSVVNLGGGSITNSSVNRYSINNLVAGTYVVNITDANGCLRSFQIPVSTTSGSLNASLASTNPSCGGASNGSITATPIQGQFPFTFQLNGGAPQSTGSFTGLPVGLYTVVVRDNNGCVWTRNLSLGEGTFTIAENVDYRLTNARCPGSNSGSFTVVNANNQYAIFTSNGTAVPSNEWNALSIGVYRVVASQGACRTIQSFEVKGPNDWYVEFNVLPVTCAGADGSASIRVTGATAPYTYRWQNGSTSASLTGLALGNYQVTINDANGCSVVDRFSVIDACLCTNFRIASMIYDKPTCGASNGSVTATALNGRSPISYTWLTTPTRPTQTISNIAAGIYTAIAVDANGCRDTAIVAVENLTGPLARVATITPSACNTATGVVIFNITGGSAPYTLATTSGQVNNANSSVSGLLPGRYIVTVRDATGCIGFVNVTIPTGAGNLRVSYASTSPTCGLADGAIQVTPQGVSFPATYSLVASGSSVPVIFPNATAAHTFTNLRQGIYTITTVDANGCSTVGTVILNSTGQIPLNWTNFVLTNITCPGAQNGSISLNSTSTINPRTVYVVDRVTGRQIGHLPISNLAPSSYNLIVYNGACIISDTFAIKDKPEWQIGKGSANPNCRSGQAFVDITVAGASPNYRFAWSHSSTASTSRINNLYPGTYKFTVTDVNGCNYTDSIKVKPCSQIIRDTVVSGQRRVVCVDRTDLSGPAQATTFGPCTGTIRYASSYDLNPSTGCLTYNAANPAVGIDTFCTITCDSKGVCDTTFIYMHVIYPNCNGFGFERNYYSQIYDANCKDSARVCFPIPYGDRSQYQVTLDGQPYAGTIDPCDIRTQAVYIVSTACPPTTSGNNFRVTWTYNGRIYGPSIISSVTDLPTLINGWERSNGWRYLAGANTLVGGDSASIAGGSYGELRIVCLSTLVETRDQPRVDQVPNASTVRVPIGTHTVRFTNVYGCSDFSTVQVYCTPTTVINDTLVLTGRRRLCFNSSNVPLNPGASLTVREVCDGPTTGDAATFGTPIINGRQICVEYTTNRVGIDTACFVVCGSNGICDTVRILPSIYQLKPIAVNDTIRLALGQEKQVIDICANDQGGRYNQISSIEVVYNPLFGSISTTNNCQIEYTFTSKECSKNGLPIDSFVYVIKNSAGTATATVYIYSTCSRFVIYNGFSPNGDNMNEVFFIEGIQNYPKSTLNIYNRWGNKVHYAKGYQNDWTGTWNDSRLPDGTYFYRLDLEDGSGTIHSGYIEIFR